MNIWIKDGEGEGNEGQENSGWGGREGGEQCRNWIQNDYVLCHMKNEIDGWNYQARNLEETILVNLCMSYKTYYVIFHCGAHG